MKSYKSEIKKYAAKNGIENMSAKKVSAKTFLEKYNFWKPEFNVETSFDGLKHSVQIASIGNNADTAELIYYLL